jgi:iron-regulated transporter 1
MNVALSPGGLTTAFLTSKGLDGSALAIFRGSCAVMGFLGTWYGKHLIEKHGLVKAGNHALFMLLASLGISFVMYSLFLSHGAMGHSLMFSIGGVSAPVVIFSLGIVFSRIGLWSFDMVNAQLFQQNVDETEAAATSSTEMALCMFVELFMLGLAAYVLLEDSFHVLVNASIGAVMLGSFVFNMWSRSNRVSLVHCESN